MSFKTLGLNLATAEAAAAVAMDTSPLAAGGGRKGILIVAPENTAAADANQVGDLQGSLDGSTGWTDVQAFAAADGWKMFEVLLWPHMRINVESGTAGGGTSFFILPSH